MKKMFGQIKGFISATTGKTVDIFHPCVVLEKDNKQMVFVFSHDDIYAIKENPTMYSVTSEQKFSNTKILTQKDLALTREYYWEKMNDKRLPFRERDNARKIYENCHIGFKCEHPIEKNRAFLEKDVPCFQKDRKIHYVQTRPRNERENEMEIMKKDKSFYIDALKIIESAMICDKLNKYESGFETPEIIAEPFKEKFTLKERIDFAFEVRQEQKIQKLPYDCEKSQIYKINASSKTPFVEKLLQTNFLSEKDKEEIPSLMPIFKLEDLDKRMDFYEKEISFREEKLSVIEKQCGAGSIEKTAKFKEELKVFNQEINLVEIELEKFLNEHDIPNDFEPLSDYLKAKTCDLVEYDDDVE